jgi:Fic family protein
VTPPIDAAEFDAHKDLASVITQYLCRNPDEGYSSKEISQATGIQEADVANAMLKLGLSDVAAKLSGRKKKFRIDDVTVNGVIYYRCVPLDS